MSSHNTFLFRAGKIVRVFIGLYFNAFFFLGKKRKLSPEKKAVLVRKSFEELGSVFVKLGQFLSMRPEFLPWEYCDELFCLLEDVPSFSYEEVEKVFEEELHRSPQKLFQKFENEPFASASLGQVHIALLKNGQKAAVKIQRPGIRQAIQQDMGIIKFFVKILSIFPLPLKVSPVLREFEEWLKEELDYRTEAVYTREFYEQSKAHADIMQVPKVFSVFSTERILVTEFIDGITLNKILAAFRNNDRTMIRKVKKWGFSPENAGEMMIKISLRQFFSEGFFHADPHPANIIFTPEGKLAYIDFGIIGKLDKRLRLLSLRFARSVLYGDEETAFEAYLQYVIITKVKDMNALKKDHDALIRHYQEVFTNKEKESGHRHFLGKFLFDGVRVSEKHGAVIPVEVLKFFRAISMFESLLFYTDPKMTVGKLARRLRNFSLVSAASEIPEMLTAENIEEMLLAFLSVFEKEILKKA